MTTGPGPGVGNTEVAQVSESTEKAKAHARNVLEDRARALARPVRVEPARGSLVALVLFEIGGVAHALEARFVREVLRRPALSPVPLGPAALIGVANVRGEILAVADVSAVLGLSAPNVPGPVIVLEGPGPSLGLLVDGVEDFVEVPTESIAARPHQDKPTESSPDSMLLGVIPSAMVLSGAALLTEPRFSTTTTTTSPLNTEPRRGR